MTPELGIIEGFYGRQWTWEARAQTASFLASHDYRFYFYAPKGDAYLRKRWQEPHPADDAAQLAAFAAHCRAAGLRFGVGLSPYEIYRDFSAGTRDALERKLEFLAGIGTDYLAILFDDMRGDTPDLAARQVEILHWVGERTAGQRLFLCPTYYSDDPLLDSIFGARPAGYLEQLGRTLDPSIELFWTGEEIAPPEISATHLQRVAEVLHRKPFLWDNYPVNDTARLSRFIHVRAFTGRPAAIAEHVRGHAINPALQPVLSLIPALTLVESYRAGSAYQYSQAFRRAAAEVLGTELAERVREDLMLLQNIGLERLTAEQLAQLHAHYHGVDHEAAREIMGWLAGEYLTPEDIALTQ